MKDNMNNYDAIEYCIYAMENLKSAYGFVESNDVKDALAKQIEAVKIIITLISADETSYVLKR